MQNQPSASVLQTGLQRTAGSISTHFAQYLSDIRNRSTMRWEGVQVQRPTPVICVQFLQKSFIFDASSFCISLQQFMKISQSEHHDREQSSSSSPRHREEKSEQPLIRYKLQQTRTLMLQNAEDILAQIEVKFTDLSINVGTSVPDEVEARLNSVYVRYPSVQAAAAVFRYLKGQINIKNKQFKLQYYPVRKVDLTLAYDWYCDKCDYKNFARRNKCYRCESQKSVDCRLSYSTQPSCRGVQQESAQNCSLMIRGPIVGQVEQNVLLQTFEAMVPVRDVRQIKNKLTGKFKDFAFVQFYSPEQTAQAYKLANQSTFRIASQRVTVMYSRNKSDDDYFKPLPYEAGKREKKAKERPQQEDNYYHRQRQREIQEEKARPSITMEQLREKREQELKKQHQANVPKEMNEEQSRRRAAQQLAKQWQREMKVPALMYLCPACCRKFTNAEQMKVHQKMSKLHIYNMQKISSLALAI